ncbi:potassium voltage-gated channel subfamily E member 3 isoform X1 [Dermochelys coriacea]|uniref:potassium voltage-gated channel subfamily E member 3 isoform X1 n=2 Tax=Dermochelys coriacea TaxID=27794 RepID=UPI0018E8535C|nr:potassium voltage-gated channel subfamily E member 3 isoform X1 [Dermochelys coriacea]
MAAAGGRCAPLPAAAGGAGAGAGAPTCCSHSRAAGSERRISVSVHLHNGTDANTTWPLCLALWMGDAVKFPGNCEDMEVGNLTETLYQSLHSLLKALNQTLHGAILCPPDQATRWTNGSHIKLASKDDYSYTYILFVMILFAATVGSLILGYTKSRKVDKRSDPYHIYIKDRVSMI